jgi:hypothetical protein
LVDLIASEFDLVYDHHAKIKARHEIALKQVMIPQ